MEAGFHSLVQVLLEAGAPIQQGNYSALEHAVNLRRPDLAELMFQHGADINDVPMRLVVSMWQPEMVEMFVSNGASLVRDKPIAWGLVHKIRPVLGLLKRHVSENRELMEQAELALRFHAGEGNSKWVAFTLWVGADPLARGPDRLEDDESHEGVEQEDHGYLNAVEIAVSQGKLDILKQKKLYRAMAPTRPEASRLLEHACHASDRKALSLLLDIGHSPELLPDRGTRAITWLVHSMSWSISLVDNKLWVEDRSRGGIDSSRARERMKMLHMLVASGAQWLPANRRAIADVRRSMLKMAPGYILEFVWLMQHYGAARRNDVQELLRTSAMARLLAKDLGRAHDLVDAIPNGSRHSGEMPPVDALRPAHQ